MKSLGSKSSTFLKVQDKLTIFLTSLYPSIASAATNDCQSTNGEWPDCIPKTNLLTLLGKVINALLAIAGTVAVLFIIIGGFQYITSAGNPDNVGKAKNTILYAIIGLVVVILSYAVVKFVIEAFK